MDLQLSNKRMMRPGVRAVVETESRKEQMNVKDMVNTKLKLPALNSRSSI